MPRQRGVGFVVLESLLVWLSLSLLTQEAAALQYSSPELLLVNIEPPRVILGYDLPSKTQLVQNLNSYISPDSMALGPDGFIYVADYYTNTLYVSCCCWYLEVDARKSN